MPAAVISIEAPGANDVGVYHNAGGLDVSALEAKSVVLWEKLRALGVPSVAIGDLGNEIGMGKIADHIRSFVPFTAHGECSCGCKGGILAASTADSQYRPLSPPATPPVYRLSPSARDTHTGILPSKAYTPSFPR